MPTELSRQFRRFLEERDIPAPRQNPETAIREVFAAFLAAQGLSPTRFEEEDWYALGEEYGLPPEEIADYLAGLGEWWPA